MDLSTILKYRLKNSLKSVGLFYLFFLGSNGFIRLILMFFSNSYFGLDFHIHVFGGSFIFASLIFFCVFIGVSERANYHLFGQFNLSRKKHFLVSYLHLLILAFTMFLVHALISSLIYLQSGINFYSLEPYVQFLQSPLLSLFTLLTLIFILFILAGSCGLVISYLTIRFSSLWVSLGIIGMCMIAFQFLIDSFTLIPGGFTVESSNRLATLAGLTEQGINLLHPLKFLLIFSLINLLISKWISKSINIKKLGRT